MFVCVDLLDEEDQLAWQAVDAALAAELGLTHSIWGEMLETKKLRCSLLPSTLYYGDVPSSMPIQDLSERVIEVIRPHVAGSYNIIVLQATNWCRRGNGNRSLSEAPKLATSVSSGDIEDSGSRVP